MRTSWYYSDVGENSGHVFWVWDNWKMGLNDLDNNLVNRHLQRKSNYPTWQNTHSMYGHSYQEHFPERELLTAKYLYV